MQNTTRYVTVAADSDNQSILILGRSGSGKTYAMQEIEKNIASVQGAVLVLNFHDTHSSLKGRGDVYWIDAFAEGVPLKLLSPIVRPDGSMEDDENVCEWVVDIFSNVSPLGTRQKRMLRKAVKNAMSRQEDEINDAKVLGNALRELDDDIAETIYDKHYEFFTRGKVGGNQRLIQRGKITVIDLERYSSRTQCLIAEMLLSLLWRYFQIWGQCAETTLFVVCDEFQGLNMQPESVLCQILREGRKYNLALLLITQTLMGWKPEKKAVLQQAATRLYFHPAPNEVSGIVKELGVSREEASEFRKSLLRLQKGEAIVMGRLKAGSLIFERPTQISFREKTEYN